MEYADLHLLKNPELGQLPLAHSCHQRSCLFLHLLSVFCGYAHLKGSSPRDHRMAAHNSWMTRFPLPIRGQLVPLKEPTSFSQIPSNVSLKFVDLSQSVWPGERNGLIPFPHIICLTSRVDPSGQPRPGASRKGKEKWCWECHPQRSMALAYRKRCLPPLISYSSRTSQKLCTWWQKGEAVRDGGEREQSSNCRHSLLEFSKSSLANPECPWVKS